MTAATSSNVGTSVPTNGERQIDQSDTIGDGTAERAREIRNEIQGILNDMGESVKKMSESILEKIGNLKGKVDEIDQSIMDGRRVPSGTPDRSTRNVLNNDNRSSVT